MADNSRTVVSYKARFTRNMRDFESLQVEVGCEDGLRGDENVSQAFNRVRDFVESRLLDHVESLESEIRAVHPLPSSK